MENTTPMGEEAITLVTENMVDMQEPLNSLKFLLGFCSTVTIIICILS